MSAEEHLVEEMGRRNWIILVLLLVGSGLARRPDFTLGLLCGGLTVVAGYHWQHRDLVKALSRQQTGAVRSFQVGYFLRLLAMAGILVLFIAVLKVNLAGLVIGLSVVVINIMWTTVKRIF